MYLQRVIRNHANCRIAPKTVEQSIHKKYSSPLTSNIFDTFPVPNSNIANFTNFHFDIWLGSQIAKKN